MTPRVSLAEFRALKKKAQERKEKRDAKAELLWPPKVSRRKLPSRSKLEKALWNACSLYIRTKGKREHGPYCFWCRIRPIECAMHLIPRGRRATKYDEDNLTAGCHICNGLDGPFGQHDRFVAIFIERFGAEKYLALEKKSHEICKHNKRDIIEMTEMFKKKLEEILVSPTKNV